MSTQCLRFPFVLLLLPLSVGAAEVAKQSSDSYRYSAHTRRRAIRVPPSDHGSPYFRGRHR
jgi:hypothetical protein